ncbi:MAG: type IV pilin protein [Candidatus Avelusimicrobium sp.]|uniref:type IV pilin protein n=1 Tax=Candidatus Avelusimicrobium sp. TaxID=3048833 RepID=UPI003F0F7482
MKGFTFGRHPEFISGSNKQGFTLIELLVVVLIIGILASVALPQYQKAVLKSRTAEVWANLKTLNMAANAYCLENPSGSGYYFGNQNSDLASALAVDVKSSKYFTYQGYVDCSSSTPIAFGASSFNASPNPIFLWLNAKTGRRSCSDGVGETTGSHDCAKIGFTNSSSNSSICTCGVGCGASSCYYAD